MAVRLIKKSWWVDFRASHLRFRRKSPENTRAGAQAYEALLRQKLARGEPIDTKDVKEKEQTFEQFAERWFSDYVKANNKYSEQYGKKKVLEASLIPFFGRMPISQIKANHIEQYKAREVASGLSNKTVNNRLAILRKCLNCAHEWLEVPIPTIKMLRCATPKTDYLTAAECEQLLEHSEGQMRTMILLALRTGMRQGEIRGLQWSSVDWESRSIVVRHSLCMTKKELVSPKSHKERHIPLDVDLYDLLYQARRKAGFVFLGPYGKPYTCHRILDELAEVCSKAGLRKIGWHALRHTFATQLATKAVALPIVQSLLGHSSITTTMRYAHVAPSAQREAIAMLNPKTALNANFWATGGQPVTPVPKIGLQI